MATIDEARLARIEGRLEAGYAAYNVAQGIWDMQQDIAALLPALRAARAALAEAVDTWTPLAQCDSMQEGDELTAFEARARALLAGEA